MALLNTKNADALQSLMTETIFDIDFPLLADMEDMVNRSAIVPDGTEDHAKEEIMSTPTLQLYGGNKKNILFIVDKLGVQFFSKEAELAFLKTLEAMKLDLNDVVVINCTSLDQQIDFEFIRKELSPTYWIFLGANPTSIRLEEYPENIWNPGGGSQVLRTHSFDEMLTDVEKKRVFWNAVKLIKN